MEHLHPAVVARLDALRADPTEADVLLDGWLRRFGSVADRALRRTVLAECLAATDDGSLLGVLLRIETRATAGDSACRWVATEMALTPSVLSELPYARCADLYAVARGAGEDRLAARFLGHHGVQHDRRTPKANPHHGATAGERTAAARRTDRLVLDRLLHDRDPRVVAALLDNPRVTERDVVRIAAMRPTVPEIPERIAQHPRWAQRYDVRKAIAFNPSTPVAVATQLLPTLLRQDLHALADSGALSPPIRAAVRALLRA